MNKFSASMRQLSVYYPGCSLVIPDPVCSDCPEKELGRVRSIFLQKTDFEFSDITNPLEWAQAIQDRSIFVYPFTKGSFTMSEVLTDGFGNVDQDLDSYEFNIAAMEPNLAANRDHWNALKKAHNYRVGWRSQTKIYRSAVAATIIPKFGIEDDPKSKVIWNLGFKFVQEAIPEILDMPVGTFDRCIEPS